MILFCYKMEEGNQEHLYLLLLYELFGMMSMSIREIQLLNYLRCELYHYLQQFLEHKLQSDGELCSLIMLIYFVVNNLYMK